MAQQTKPCPKCKEICGWWEKINTSYHQYYTPDGNGDFVDDQTSGYGRGGKVKFCFQCNKIITDRIEE